MAGRWQTSTNTVDETLDDGAQTKTYNLSKSNFLSDVSMRIRATNGATSNLVAGANSIDQRVTKIEVLAQSSTMKSYSGIQCLRLAKFALGIWPSGDETQQNDAVQFQEFPILFSRGPGDEAAMLPAKLFKSLQLKVTVNINIAATEYATTTGRIQIVEREWISDDNPLSKFILKETETETYTSVAAGDKDFDIPLGQTIRRIMVQAYETAIEEGTDVTHIKVGFNNFTETPIDADWCMLQAQNKRDFHLDDFLKAVHLMGANTDTYASRVSRIKAAVGTSGVALDLETCTAIAGDRITIGLSDVATPTAITVDQVSKWIIVGAVGNPFCVMLNFDLAGDFSQGIPTALLDSMKVRITNGGAGAAVAIVTQEVLLLA